MEPCPCCNQPTPVRTDLSTVSMVYVCTPCLVEWTPGCRTPSPHGDSAMAGIGLGFPMESRARLLLDPQVGREPRRHEPFAGYPLRRRAELTAAES